MVHFENPFQPAISLPQHLDKSAKNNTQSIGNKLFIRTSEFYDWLMGTWLANHANQAETYQRINQILRIADCSREQGLFLTSIDEDKTLECLEMCREQLYNGEIRTQGIPLAITNILFSLTHNNPKALLIAKLTEIEYKFCIYPAQKKEFLKDNATETLKQLIHQTVREINPRLVDIKALELARELSAFLETDRSMHELQQVIQNWLSSMLY